MVSKHIRGCQKRQDLFSKAEEEKEYRQMEKKIKGQYKAYEVQNEFCPFSSRFFTAPLGAAPSRQDRKTSVVSICLGNLTK